MLKTWDWLATLIAVSLPRRITYWAALHLLARYTRNHPQTELDKVNFVAAVVEWGNELQR